MLRPQNTIPVPPPGVVIIFRSEIGAVFYKNSDEKVLATEGYHGVFRIENPTFSRYENLTGKKLKVEKWIPDEFIFSLSEIVVAGGGWGRSRSSSSSSSVTPAYGDFYFIGDAFVPGFHAPTGFTAQNNSGIVLATDPTTGDYFRVTAAGLYLINYSYGPPESDGSSVFAIVTNQETVDPGTDHPGSRITTIDNEQSMAGNVIVSLPAGGTIQFREREGIASLIHSNETDSLSIAITILKVA